MRHVLHSTQGKAPSMGIGDPLGIDWATDEASRRPVLALRCRPALRSASSTALLGGRGSAGGRSRRQGPGPESAVP